MNADEVESEQDIRHASAGTTDREHQRWSNHNDTVKLMISAYTFVITYVCVGCKSTQLGSPWVQKQVLHHISFLPDGTLDDLEEASDVSDEHNFLSELLIYALRM